jgi:hypothetical protein
MTSIRKLLFLVTTFALVAFALPVQAVNNKIIGLTATSLTATTVRVTVQNLTPTGNANVSSFTVFVHSGGTITSLVANVGASDGALGTVTIAPNGKSVSVESISSTPLQFMESYSLDLAVVSGGLTCPVITTWDAIGYTGSKVGGNNPSSQFALSPTPPPYPSSSTACQTTGAPLGCGDSLDPGILNNGNPNPDPNKPGSAFAKRGLFDKIGVCGPDVDYSVSNTLLGDGTLVVAWNTSQDPHAALTYSANGKLRPIGPTGWTDAIRPQVAWVEDPLGSGNAAFIVGLDCLGTNVTSGNMPGPYGTLVTPGITTTSQSQFVIDVSSPQPGWATLPPVGATSTPLVLATGSPFALERMLLINVASGPGANQFTLTVDTTGGRAKGGTTAGTWAAGTFITSTPMPIIPAVAPFTTSTIPAYQPGQRVHICIQEYGFTAYGNGTGFDFATANDDGDGSLKFP